MSRCYCGCLLGILVIVFAWLPVSWANIALTVLGALLTIKALVGTCCCATKQEQGKSATPSGAGE
jgi:hypothetical protein